MEEFKHLPWPIADFGTNLHETYTLNMPDYRKNNPTDAFFCNLLEIEPVHFQHMEEKMLDPNGTESVSDELMPLKFIDPRTNIEIPSHECNHKDVNLESRNFFLKNYIQASSMPKSQHIAGLNAAHGLEPSSEQTADEQNNRTLYESNAANRFQERQLFLDKLREHYFEKLSKRFHEVPPSINYFITHKWKKQLIEMYRRLANARYCMRTAISLQPSQCAVKCNILHQEHLGNVPKMSSKPIDYLKQSFSNLLNDYNQQKTIRMLAAVTAKVNEMIQGHGIDFVIPISIVKLILNSNKNDWSFCVTVRESASSTPFQTKKEIIFEKPLPSMYLSGNDRYHKGAKYLLHSCLNQNASHCFNYNDQIELKMGVDTDILPPEIESKTNDSNETIEYKICSYDQFIKEHPKNECCYENRTFTIIEMTGCDEIENVDETFKILVPAKQAAYKKNEKNEEIQFVNYSPKIEFQAEYGAEVMTHDELLHEWCDLFFRPKTSTERVRFDSVSGKIVHRQTISLMQVNNELEDRFGIEVQHLLQRLWNVLCKLNEFPIGKYLLQGDKKQLACVKVYEKVENDMNGIGISQFFQNVTFEQNIFDKAEWYPIDDKIVTELHDKLQILPCAFPHAEYLRENYVKHPIDGRIKPAKAIKMPLKFSKICPKNDSHLIKKKLEANQLKRKKNTKPVKRAKNQKKAKARASKKALHEARSIETKEFESTKNLLVATMDQYNTLSGQSLNVISVESTNTDDCSIATRTRNRTKISTPEKPTRPAMNKSYKI